MLFFIAYSFEMSSLLDTIPNQCQRFPAAFPTPKFVNRSISAPLINPLRSRALITRDFSPALQKANLPHTKKNRANSPFPDSDMPTRAKTHKYQRRSVVAFVIVRPSRLTLTGSSRRDRTSFNHGH